MSTDPRNQMKNPEIGGKQSEQRTIIYLFNRGGEANRKRSNPRYEDMEKSQRRLKLLLRSNHGDRGIEHRRRTGCHNQETEKTRCCCDLHTRETETKKTVWIRVGLDLSVFAVDGSVCRGNQATNDRCPKLMLKPVNIGRKSHFEKTTTY